jgi:hypothetical protein
MLTHSMRHLHCVCCNCVLQQLALLEAIESASLTHFKMIFRCFASWTVGIARFFMLHLGLIAASTGFMYVLLPRPAHTPKSECQSGIILTITIVDYFA